MKTTTHSPATPRAGKPKLTAPFRVTEAPAPDVIELVPRMMSIREILVPIDFSATSLKSLQYAVPFAKQFDAKLTLVHVVEMPVYPESPYSVPLGPEELEAIKKELAQICAAKIPPEIPVEIAVRQNSVFEGILEVARENSTDLIITTTHGRTGLKHLVMGSTAEDIVRRAPCPVLVVREREHEFVEC